MAAPVLDDAGPVPEAEPPVAAEHLRLGRLVLEAVVVGLVAVAMAFVVWGFRGPGLDAPLNYEDDAAFYLMQARLLEQSDWSTSASLGWEGGFQLYDLPQGADSFNLVVMRGVSFVVHEPAEILNTFFLLTYGFVAGLAYAVLRHLRVRLPLAAAGGLLYAFLPYHQVRNTGHVLLSNYAMVPVAVLLALALLGDDPPIVGEGRGWRGRIAWRSGRTWWVVAACAGLASTGAYYAVFGALLVLAAGTFGAIGQWRWRPVVASAVMVAVLGAVFFVNQSPSLWYWARNGTNTEVARRQIWETELYGLRINQLFLPVDDHRLPALARLARLDNETPLRATEPGQQLGGLAAAGVTAGLVVAAAGLLAGRRRRVWFDAQPLEGVGRVGMLALACMVTGAVGGLSYLLAGAGLREIRSWNRISVLIGFLGVLVVVWAAQWLADRWSQRRPNVPAWAAGTALAVPLFAVGFLDSVPARLSPPPAFVERQDMHRAFFEQVADTLPAGSPVLQIPHIAFPEPDDQNPVGSYDPARGYVYAPGLRWTFGWVTGRGDSLAASLDQIPAAEVAGAARAEGFAGIVLDRVGVPDPDAYEAELVASVGGTPIRSGDGRYVFVDLRTG